MWKNDKGDTVLAIPWFKSDDRPMWNSALRVGRKENKPPATQLLIVRGFSMSEVFATSDKTLNRLQSTSALFFLDNHVRTLTMIDVELPSPKNGY